MGTKPAINWDKCAIEVKGGANILNEITAGQTYKWHDPKKELPPIGSRVLVHTGDEPIVCWYTKTGRFKTTLRCKERYHYDRVQSVKVHLSPCREDITDIVIAWMPIPPLYF